MTEEVFLNQIRILSLHMIFPIWISGFCILLRVVQIEPNDNVDFSVISSSTRVIVIPEYREEKIIQPEQTSSLPSDTHIESSISLKTFVRSIGTFVCSSLHNSSILSEKKSIDKIA